MVNDGADASASGEVAFAQSGCQADAEETYEALSHCGTAMLFRKNRPEMAMRFMENIRMTYPLRSFGLILQNMAQMPNLQENTAGRSQLVSVLELRKRNRRRW